MNYIIHNLEERSWELRPGMLLPVAFALSRFEMVLERDMHAHTHDTMTKWVKFRWTVILLHVSYLLVLTGLSGKKTTGRMDWRERERERERECVCMTDVKRYLGHLVLGPWKDSLHISSKTSKSPWSRTNPRRGQFTQPDSHIDPSILQRYSSATAI